MSGFRRRRPPDPSRPGTIYRSKPKLGRSRGLSAGPPYLDSGQGGSAAEPSSPSGDPFDRSSATPAGGVGAGGVGTVYRDHGGDPQPADQYGNLLDHREGEPRRPGSQPGYPGGPGQRGPGPARPGGPGGAGGVGVPAWLRRLRRPRLSLIIVVVLVLLIGYPVLLGVTAWKSVNRVNALAPAHAVTDTADTPGTTYLVVGSDSRSDLTDAERKRLGTGSTTGQRTDTIMLLHVPAGSGPTVLVSVPRDSYVSIPGHGQNKINAAYAYGGAPLLIRTLEQASGVRIDEYVETGLGGFASVVDALGGVTLCPKFNMKDKDAHINLKKGCQPMDGKTALGYARARHSDPRGDLGRVERQRETLAAIAKKTLAPSTLIQPWRAFPAAKAGGGALTVDESTSPLGLAHFVLAMRAVAGGGGLSLTVPISNPDFRTPSGASAVQWDRAQALTLFHDLKVDNTEAIKPIAAAQKQK